MSNIRRRPVAFNLDNALEKGLTDWCDQQSPNNFSGFVKMVLFAHKNSKSTTQADITPIIEPHDNKQGLLSIL